MSDKKQCYVCGKKYASWNYLFYHKRKVHNDISVQSTKYDTEMRNKAEEIKKNQPINCILCAEMHPKSKMEKHYLEAHKEHFAWVCCEICVQYPSKNSDVRYDIFKEHILEHNATNRHTSPEHLTQIIDDKGCKAAIEYILDIKRQSDEMNERNRNRTYDYRFFEPLISYCPFSGEMIGMWQ